MDKWNIVDLVEKGVSRAKIRKQVQVSGYLCDRDALFSQGNNSVQVTTYWDEGYPESLKEIPDPPVVIFFRGSLTTKKFATVVGSRRTSEAGKGAVRRVVPELVKMGYGIVSGLAMGIDTLGHRCCLDNGGVAVAVLPVPVDRIYPPGNIGLAEEIIDHGGCLVSEYPAGHVTRRRDFLERNRIMIGLSDFLIVAEARRFSGTTATANFALDQGKEVYVLTDENGEPIGEGAKELMSDGAKVIEYAI